MFNVHTDELLIEQTNATASDAVRKRGRPSNTARAGLVRDPRVGGGVPKSDAPNGSANCKHGETNCGYEGGCSAEVGTVSCATATLLSATKQAKKGAKLANGSGEEAAYDENRKRDKQETTEADKLYAVQFGEAGAEADNKRIKYTLAELDKFLAAQGASGLPSGFNEGGYADDERDKLCRQHK